MKTLEQFDVRERSYPFPDGTLQEGILVRQHSVLFTGQHGPVKEVGVNGCQIDDIIKFVRLTLEAFNKQFPCRENSIAITKLEEAELWLLRRTQNREARGVEGKSEK